jgi:hypothetical protein
MCVVLSAALISLLLVLRLRCAVLLRRGLALLLLAGSVILSDALAADVALLFAAAPLVAAGSPALGTARSVGP